jgi:hypothetical protein
MIRRVASRAMKFLPAEHHPPHEPLDIRASSLIAIQDVELTAKRPQLLFDWFGRHGPANVAELDLNDDGVGLLFLHRSNDSQVTTLCPTNP